METLTLIFGGVFGLIIGSFLNVCILRIPAEKSIAWPASHCPKCKNPIKWYDNIPVISWIVLLGKCRNCREKISAQYILVESFTALITVAFIWKFGLTWWTAAGLVAVYSLIILSVIDMHTFMIPDRFSLGLIVWGLAFFWCNPYFSGSYLNMFLQSLGGAAAGFFGLLLVALLGRLIFRKDAMGGGDIKLMGGVGAILGWQGVVSTLILSCFLGLFYAVYQIIFKKTNDERTIPFGPFISMAMLINMFYYVTPMQMVNFVNSIISKVTGL
ncbi:leader peptidase (prepilin peptidase) / N-methyltransferase [Parelusimicrobium proximum]|uniref:prepilin peptidase n=1 Tax=Parelusimicrobium proximum TaxID=3228953 RepID=UPI003D169D28